MNKIRNSKIKETTNNLQYILTALEEGSEADNQLMIEMINTMVDFTNKLCVAANRSLEKTTEDVKKTLEQVVSTEQ